MQGENEKKKTNTLPALVYVAAGNGISCVKAQLINFNYFNAADVVVERFCSLRGKKKSFI